jgi:formylglycine-generating enzyme required for sulfatase activity
MKRVNISILNLFIVAIVSGQTEPTENQHQGMVLVPQGSYEMKITRNSETKVRNVTLDAFWMSNEITNREFRSFIEWAGNNPTEKLYQTKYLTKVVTDPKKGITKDTVVMETIPIEVSHINEQFDPLCLEKANPEYKGYFTDKKYDDYPVAGVSYNLAEYYCLWKTMKEDRQRKEKGLSQIQPYMLPLESQWEYAAQKTIKQKESASSGLQKVSGGTPNDLDLYHFADNVSEWVRSTNQGIVRGGSWTSDSDRNISFRTVKDMNSRDANVGFRIIQAYVPDK